MKASIIFHSETGNTKAVAEHVAEGIRRVDGVDVRIMPIDAVDKDFAADSRLVVLGTPTYGGTYSWQMKTWLHKGGVKLAGKLGGVFATENFIGGGADFAEMILVGEMLVRGMVVYSGGAACGHPFTHFGAIAIKDGDDAQKERARIFGERLAAKATELFGNG
jgi:NAD(P)H dehydrogenase (quinone)